jgi:LmbE family N-acetylglucosaminyl deacetylase
MAEEEKQAEQTAPAPKRALVVMAHPDDGEFIAGGTIARWAREGWEVYYCVVTDGNCGSSDPEMTSEKLIALRHEEHKAAARMLGAKEALFLHYVDSMLEPTLQVRKDIARLIRQVRPERMICQDPTMFWGGQGYINHPDHRAAGEATLAAIMPAAGTRLIFPDLLKEGLEPHDVGELYLASSRNADRWVDISETLEVKIEALRQHKSQIKDWNPEEEMTSWAKGTAEEARKHGHDFKYAEAFKYFRFRDGE